MSDPIPEDLRELNGRLWQLASELRSVISQIRHPWTANQAERAGDRLFLAAKILDVAIVEAAAVIEAAAAELGVAATALPPEKKEEK